MTDPSSPPIGDTASPAKAPGGTTIAGGQPRVKSIRAFTCPGCGGQITVRAAGMSLCAVCAHCGRVIDVSDENLVIISAAETAARPTTLEIGARGKLHGIIWEVIGYTLKKDKTGVYYWDEYLLFNPYNGFRFLVSMEGHWSFVKMLKQEIQRRSVFNSSFTFDGDNYRPFLQDDPSVAYVKGEFYWRVKKGDTAHEEDFVHPPHMLSFERSDGDITASLCDYIEPSVIAGAFPLSQPMPHRKGVAPNQPSPYRVKPLAVVGGIAAVIAFVIYLATAASSAGVTVFDVANTHVPGDQTLSFTSPPIEVPEQTNMEIRSWAKVDNEWAELGLSLENEATGQTFDVRQAIEYYHGYDSDGSWSEGSDFANDYFSGVPKGTYRLVYEVDSGLLRKGQKVDVGIKVIRGVAPASNFFIALFLLLLWPVFAMLRSSSFETKRWSNSDFATE